MIDTPSILCAEHLPCCPAPLSRCSNTAACLPGTAGKLTDHSFIMHLLEVLTAAVDFVQSCKENASNNKDLLWVSRWMIILYRKSVKRARGEKRLKEELCSPQRYQHCHLHQCFIGLMQLQCSMEGTSPGKKPHAVHEHLLHKPRQTKGEARALLCALEEEDSGFGFILGKRGSPSRMEELWHGHRQRQHTQLYPKLSNKHS